MCVVCVCVCVCVCVHARTHVCECVCMCVYVCCVCMCVCVCVCVWSHVHVLHVCTVIVELINLRYNQYITDSLQAGTLHNLHVSTETPLNLLKLLPVLTT